MQRLVADVAGFEAKFQADIDPWNYGASPFEAYKRSVLLRAAGFRPYGRGLELACAIGETTRVLSPRCLRLTALDASVTALAEADRRTGALGNVTLERATLPRGAPRRRFDLIVASEILYYLRPNDLREMMVRLEDSLAPGGRLVILHHLLDFHDAAVHPRRAQAYAIARLRRRMSLVFRLDARRFQAVAFVKRRAGALGGRRHVGHDRLPE